MADPVHDRDRAASALAGVTAAAGPYLDSLAERPVLDAAAAELLADLGGPLPEDGVGTAATVERLLRVGTATATASSGPRFFHFVTGGATPAALAADWTASLLDQNAFARASSALGTEVETVALGLAARPVRPARGLGRRAGRERHVRELHLARLRHPLVGRTARCRHHVATGSPACPGCRCSPAGTSTRAPARRCRCSATAGTRRGVRPRRGRPGRPGRDGTPTRRTGRRARGDHRQRRRGQRRRLRPDRRRWPTWPSGTAPGCTSTARSGCSPRCRRAPRT